MTDKQTIGEEIRRLLREHKELSGTDLYKQVKENLHRKINQQSFRINYLYKMKKMKLIVESGKDPSSNPNLIAKTIWKLVNPKDDSDWSDIQQRYLDWK